MKTYTETVGILANRAFHRYMAGGETDILKDTSLVAQIYDRAQSEVEVAVFHTYETIKAAYYERVTS